LRSVRDDGVRQKSSELSREGDEPSLAAACCTIEGSCVFPINVDTVQLIGSDVACKFSRTLNRIRPLTRWILSCPKGTDHELDTRIAVQFFDVGPYLIVIGSENRGGANVT
jgi:hypothetical protein